MTKSKQPRKTNDATSSNALTYINYAIGLIIVVAVTAFIATRSTEKSNPDLKIVVVNSVELTKAQMINLDKRIKENDSLDTSFVELEATKFAQSYVLALDAYREQGFIILDSKNALGWPTAVDITHQVAKRMNLTINYQPSSLADQMISKQQSNQNIN